MSVAASAAGTCSAKAKPMRAAARRAMAMMRFLCASTLTTGALKYASNASTHSGYELGHNEAHDGGLESFHIYIYIYIQVE